MDVGAAKYWAFISYSHQDEAWARWLHRRLERYVVPRRLRAQRPELPRRLYPVFRDREELPTTTHLSTAITEALQQSRALIVICSPHAAASRWVDQEVRTFKRLHGDAPVLAIIIDGEPHATDNPAVGLPECFPPALRQLLDARGQPTGVRAEPLAADARAGRDARALVLLRVLAGLLGVGFEDLRRRELVRRRWMWARNVAVAATVLGAWAGLWTWQAERQRTHERVQQRIALVDQARDELERGEFARASTLLAAAYAQGDDSVDVRLLLARALPSVEALTGAGHSTEHERWVVQLAYTPDDARILVVEHEGDARLIDRVDPQTQVRFKAPPPLSNYRFSADGARLLLSGLDADAERRQRLKVYATADGRELLDLGGAPLSWPDARAVFPQALADPALERVAIISDRGEAEIWQVEPPRRLGVLRGNQALRSVAFSPDGRELVTADGSGEVIVWDSERLQSRQRLRLRPALPTAAGYVGAQQILTLSETGALNLWNAQDGSWLGALAGHAGRVELALPSLAHGRLVTGARDGQRVWDLASLTALFAGGGEIGAVRVAELDASGRWLMALDNGNKLRLVSVPEGRLAATLDGHVGATYAAAIDAAGRYALTGGSDGQVREWDLQQLGTGPLRVLGPSRSEGGRPVVVLAGFVDAGLVSVDSDGNVCAWPQGTAAAARCEQAPAAAVRSADTDGRQLLATGSTAGEVSAWDLASLTPRWSAAAAHALPVRVLAVSPDGRWIAAGSERGLRVWNADIEQPLMWASAAPMAVTTLGFAPTADRLLVGGSGDALQLHALPTGERLWAFDGHEGGVVHAQYAPDGGSVASIDRRGVLRVWSVADGRLLHRFAPVGSGGLQRLGFAPDGRYLASCGDGGLLALYRLADGVRREFVGMPPGYCGEVRFSPDGSLVAAASVGGQAVVVWGVDSGRRLLRWQDERLHPQRLRFSDDARQLAVSGEGWDLRFPVLDLARELRSAGEIAALVRCKSPWRLHDGRLVPNAPDVHDCAEAATARVGG
jgi:WD40 repeat protein